MYTMSQNNTRKLLICIKNKKEGDNQASTNYYLGLSYARRDSFSQAYDYLRLATEQTQRKMCISFLNMELRPATWDS